MKNIKKQRYLPHDLSTRYYAVKLYRAGHSIRFVCRRHKISKASLMRWNKRFDGTRQSLADKSHRPHTAHPSAHTDEELKYIRNYTRRNPNISVNELYGKLKRNKNYTRHCASLYRVLIRQDLVKKKVKAKKTYKPQKYDTPSFIGIKWQIDVKAIPKKCYVGEYEVEFFQYTAIDEASRERFIYPYMEQSSYSSVDFIKRAIRYFKYKPFIIQTDNGTEFTHTRETNRIHPVDALLKKLHIFHQRIRPHTPRHNGKVERSHRNDQERFYNTLKFYSYTDLKNQMRNYLNRSNNIPTKVLNWKSPKEKRDELANISLKYKIYFILLLYLKTKK